MIVTHPKNGQCLYDDSDEQSILQYAYRLRGKTLAEVTSLSADSVSGNKGKFGQLLEEFYFFKKLDSEARPDFYEAKLELKSSPLKTLKRNCEIRAKERLVMNIINYEEIVSENFTDSAFLKKNAQLLLVFYLHRAEASVLEYPIRLVDKWIFPVEDLKIISRDWQLIQKKVQQGKAHELSEGDTFYLGACTKGANSDSVRSQPYSDIPAKQRAFSLKTGYVNHIIAKLSGVSDGSFGKIMTSAVLPTQNLEDIVMERFSQYLHKTDSEIAAILGVDGHNKPKNFYANLTKAILGVDTDKEIEEFSKADIVVKTVRLREKDAMPDQSISFPAFRYVDLINETEWEESTLYSLLNKKFLFIFFRYSGDLLYLEKAVFWNMPYMDLEQAQRVWQHTRNCIADGRIIKNIKADGSRETYFSGIKDNPVAHVRPHARNAADTFPLPVADRLTQVEHYTKHCFWLNAAYVRDCIYQSDI